MNPLKETIPAINSGIAKSKKRGLWIKIPAGILLTLLLLFLALSIWGATIEKDASIQPDYPKTDIMPLLLKDTLSDGDYEVLFYQTGLGKPAVDDLKREEDYIDTMLRFQENFFEDRTVTCSTAFFPVRQEMLNNTSLESPYCFELAPLYDGDVLITRSTHLFGIRLGHSGIVTDAGGDESLEAYGLGVTSSLQDVQGWRGYGSVIVLRLKEEYAGLATKAAAFAKENMVGIPYRITSGFLGRKYQEPGSIWGTQCALLVWNSFYGAGLDIDSNGGRLVIPDNILNSPYFDIVQVYGVDPLEVHP
ncbi:hypothetical protein [Anaerolentibacter hominis]|uniref:hypothetical protein n=1 Tax=Anaerolentibacter hominis TaxID=3079009 RepID=UPI0031B81799